MILFLPYIISGLAALAGFGANWWFDVTDWQTAAIFAVALVACTFVAQSNSPWSRLIITAIVAGAMYLKGGVDKELKLEQQHAAEKVAIHSRYAEAARAEKARQVAANEEAQRAAAADKERYDAELKVLQDQVKLFETDAAADKRAEEPSLSLDAVRRLNARRLRGQPES